MNDISLETMTREMCHIFYQDFENDADVFENIDTLKRYMYEKSKVDKYYESQLSENRIVFMVMLQGKPVGEVKLKDINTNTRECRIGIHLQNGTVKGKGIGTVAEKLAVEYAFNKLGMKYVYADVLHKNLRSQHVLEKVGFQFVKEDEKFKYYVIEEMHRK